MRAPALAMLLACSGAGAAWGQTWGQRLAGIWTVGEPGTCAQLRYEISDLGAEVVFRDQAGQVNVETVLLRRPEALLTQTAGSPQAPAGGRREYVQEDATTIRVRNLATGRSFALLRCPEPAGARQGAAARTQALARQYFATWSADNQTALAFGYDHYLPDLMFYGRTTPRGTVMAQKEAFVRRWPLRSYGIVPGSTAVRCTADERECEVAGTVEWTCRSPERAAVSSGTATFRLRVVFQNEAAMIAMETGSVVSRSAPNRAEPAVPVQPAAPPAILPEVDVPPPRR